VLGVRDTHRHDIRARRGLDHGQRVFAFADGTEERLLAVEPRNTCRHRSWAPRTGRTLGGATLTLLRRCRLAENRTDGNTGGTCEKYWGIQLSCMRTNDLVKAILKIVELRGLEPLTFSLRTRRATSCAIAPRIGVGRSAPRLYHRQAEAIWRASSPGSVEDESDAASGASAVTGPSWRAEDDISGPDKSIVRTVRGASGFET
jgi:hypothetical protein